MLFLFSVLYLLLLKAPITIPNISLKGAIFVTFTIGFVYSAGMDILGLRGWTKTALLDFQNERLLIYFMSFLLGALCFRLKVFDREPKGNVLYVTVNTLAWIPIMAYVVFLLYPWFYPGSFVISEIIDKVTLWVSYQVSLLALVYVTIETFRRYQNKQGKLGNELNKNSYYVYIIHVIVTGSVALIMLNTAIPSVSKHLLLTVSTFVASNLAVSLFRTAWQRLPAPRLLGGWPATHPVR